MIDQPSKPSKAHFQSETDFSERGEMDPDRERVRDLYRLIAQFADYQSGCFQTIVVDHANYSDDWFQSAVGQNWRSATNTKLIPASWIDDNADEAEA